MLEIHERKDTKGYENIVNAIESEFVHVVESINGDKVDGYGVYSIDEKGLRIYDFGSSCSEITDGVIRTILFKGMLGGLNRCEFCVSDEEKSRKLRTLGFLNGENTAIDDINAFMSSCPNCKKSK